MVVGQGTGPRFTGHSDAGPVDVLRALACSMLSTPPCVVAFSGGRDSSALLALLIDVARREQLPEPIAVTARWDADEASDEMGWQEDVARTIGVQHWEIIRPGTDLDLLGTEATSALDQLGLIWPPPAYAFLPMLRMASGGVFITGEGGDEAFGLWPYGRLWSMVRTHRLPRESHMRALVLGSLPRPLRRRRWRHNFPPYQDWLRPDAYRKVADMLADDRSDDPLRWDRYQVVSRRRRAVDLTVRTLEDLSALVGSRYVGPFLDEDFLASLGSWGGHFGRGDRSEVMSALFGDILPNPVLFRSSKATFGGVFWGPASRRFAEAWDGTGISSELVDPERLRRAWLNEIPSYGAALPLQAAWLFGPKGRQTRAGVPGSP